MKTKKEIEEIIHQNDEIVKQYGIKRLGVFGSFVRNSQKAKSDIDVLVEFKKGQKTFDNYMGLKLFLQKKFRCKVDLVIKDALKARIKTRILKEVEYARL